MANTATARQQIEATATAQGWRLRQATVTDWWPQGVDHYRRGDVELVVTYTDLGAVRNADRREGDGGHQVVNQRSRGKREQVLTWLRHDDAPRRAILEAATANGWATTSDTTADLALERGRLADVDPSLSAADDPAYEAVTIRFALDGSVELAAAKGWTRSRSGADAVDELVERMCWAPPWVECADCGHPEHRHHLGLAGWHPFQTAQPGEADRIVEVYRDGENVYRERGITSDLVTRGCPHGDGWPSDCPDCAADRSAARGAAAELADQAVGRVLRSEHDGPAPLVLDVAPATEPGIVWCETADHPATGHTHRPDCKRATETPDDGSVVEYPAAADPHQAARELVQLRAQVQQLTENLADARRMRDAALAGRDTSDLDADVSDIGGALAVLWGVARPEHKATAQTNREHVERLVRQLRADLATARSEVTALSTTLADVTVERDRLADQVETMGRQATALAARLREASAAADLAATGSATAGGDQVPDVDPALLDGHVSARQLVLAMAEGGDLVRVESAAHGRKIPGLDDMVVRVGPARRVAGYLVDDQLVTALPGEITGRLRRRAIDVPVAGAALYLAKVAHSDDRPGQSERERLAGEVARRVAREIRERRLQR